MNRYNRGPAIGGPSKATASTTCQKCLKKDNYECKAIVQERPYVSRPSRSQQLMNPKLVPKLTSDVPQDLMRKTGVADEQLAKLEQERGRKRERQSEDTDPLLPSKRLRSASFISVSTISTTLSTSPSPRPNRSTNLHRPRSPSPSQSPTRRTIRRNARPTFSRSPSPRPTTADSERKRRRGSVSSVDSYILEDERNIFRDSRERANSRSTRRKFNQVSPPTRGRKSESRSPERGRKQLANNRRVHDQGGNRNRFDNRGPLRDELQGSRAPMRDRSLSPFSKRLALTQSMNMRR